MVRTNLYWEKQLKLVVGTYYRVHIDPNPSNTISLRTHEEISLIPTGNLNGTYKFFCLKNWCTLKWRKWTEYNMPQWVINTFNNWGGGGVQ